MERVFGHLRYWYQDAETGVRTGTEREFNDASRSGRVRSTAGLEDYGNLHETDLHERSGIEAHALAARHTQMGRWPLEFGK